MTVDFDDLFEGGGDEEGGGHSLFDTEEDAMAGCDADCRAAEFDGFE